ncbi:MAG: SDR family NAD(P)-dependent oxidoreductase, partial [bacterium]|nr:SDR family NAD(P)-dependent oxidoreductase [bacterium]
MKHSTDPGALEGQTALVTGAARGIGRATCKRLAEAGCDICVNYYSSSEEAEELTTEIQALGVRAIAHQADVRDAQAIQEMMEAIRTNFGRLDIVISNAASGVLRPALEMSTKHWRWCSETNALALVHLVQHAKPLMPRGSRVLALSSLGAERAIPNYAFIGA